MKKNRFSLLATLGAFAARSQRLQPHPPQPKIVVIDRAAIMQFSKAGQDVARQVQAYANQAKTDLAGQGRALQAEGQHAAAAGRDPGARCEAEAHRRLPGQEQALQGAAQKKDEQIQGGFMQARQRWNRRWARSCSSW